MDGVGIAQCDRPLIALQGYFSWHPHKVIEKEIDEDFISSNIKEKTRGSMSMHLTSFRVKLQPTTLRIN